MKLMKFCFLYFFSLFQRIFFVCEKLKTNLKQINNKRTLVNLYKVIVLDIFIRQQQHKNCDPNSWLSVQSERERDYYSKNLSIFNIEYFFNQWLKPVLRC